MFFGRELLIRDARMSEVVVLTYMDSGCDALSLTLAQDLAYGASLNVSVQGPGAVQPPRGFFSRDVLLFPVCQW